MSLIACTECQREISDQAATCPGCGAPVGVARRGEAPEGVAPTKVERTGAKWEGIGFLLILAGIIAAATTEGAIGGVLLVAGFVTFLVGRFK